MNGTYDAFALARSVGAALSAMGAVTFDDLATIIETVTYNDNGAGLTISAAESALDGVLGYLADTYGVLAPGFFDLATRQIILGTNLESVSDSLSGTSGDDIVHAGNGNDMVIGETGYDVFDGGDGTDTLTYADLGSSLSVTASLLPSGTPHLEVTKSTGIDTAVGFENYFLTDLHDTLMITDIATFNALGDITFNALWSANPADNDTLDLSGASAGVNLPSNGTVHFYGFETIVGSDYGDVIDTADPSHSNIQGGLGNDTLGGGGGADTIDGGVGDDVLRGGEGADILVYTAGLDTLEGGIGNDVYDFTDATESDATIVFNPGDGHDVFQNWRGHVSQLVFEGIDSDDVTIDYDFTVDYTQSVPGGYTGNFTSGDLLLTYIPTGDTIFLGGMLGYYEYPNGTGVPDLGNLGTFGLVFDDTTIGGNWVYAFGGPAAVFTPSDIDPAFDTALADHETELDEEPDYSNIVGGWDGASGLFEGSPLDDTIVGSTHSDSANGGTGNDNLAGLAGDDRLDGGAGNDTLNGGAGDDAMAGGAGNDTYYVDNADDVVDEASAGSAGFDRVHSYVSFGLSDAAHFLGDIEMGVLLGTANLTVAGNGLNNLLIGNAGDNVINGLGGNDILRGMAGNDTYYVDSANDVVDESIAGSAGFDRVHSYISLNMSDAAHFLGDIEMGVLLGAGDLTVAGNGLNNLLVGNAGDNVINGLGGNDILRGMAGNDTYYVDNANDLVDESIAGSAGFDRVHSYISLNMSDAARFLGDIEMGVLLGAGDLTLTGNALNNLLVGNAGDNVINGLGGNDVMQGMAGNDTYIVDSANDIVDESVSGSDGFDRIHSALTVNLWDVNDVRGTVEMAVLTGTGNVNASGNAVNNLIIGNSADNVLNGGWGNDILTGNGGADTFFFSTALDAVDNVDSITDFSVADDTIRLQGGIFTALPSGMLAASAFTIAAAATTADQRIVYDSGTGALSYDADGDGAGAAIRFATLAAGLALTNADFVVA